MEYTVNGLLSYLLTFNIKREPNNSNRSSRNPSLSFLDYNYWYYCLSWILE